MRVQHQILHNLKEAETVTIDPDIVAKVQAEYDKAKPEIRKEIEQEFRQFCRDMKGYFTPEEIRNLPETKAYRDALIDPEDIWCECPEEYDVDYKPDGETYLGVSKHAYICKKCKKYVQIG